MSAAIHIIIDAQDAADAPESPYTLNTYPADDDGLRSREPVEYDDGSSCIIGSNIPTMLRLLASEIEAGTVTHFGNPVEIEVTS